jgi:hypothetical protein
VPPAVVPVISRCEALTVELPALMAATMLLPEVVLTLLAVVAVSALAAVRLRMV